MYAYADQNFLITCAETPSLAQKAYSYRETKAVRFVLSPWHFYEIGKIESNRAAALLNFAETLDPVWILDRSDLEVAEFREAWGKFYGYPRPPFEPITTLANVASTLLRKPAAALSHVELRDFISVFAKGGTQSITLTLDDQQRIASQNQQTVHAGGMTAAVQERIKLSYGMLMLARQHETSSNRVELEERVQALRRDSFQQSLLQHFVRQGGFDSLRAWQVESLLTDMHHEGKAKLNHNRQIDRQHAISALAYCDVFLTDDKELTKLCSRVRTNVSFKTATVQSAAEFFDSHGQP